jgi:hypothetical protein
VSDSIFQTDTPSVTDAADGTNYTMGTYFVPAVAGTVTGRWFAPLSGPAGGLLPIAAQLWDVALNSIIATGTIPNPLSLGAWNTFTLSTHSLTAGRTYCLSVLTNQYVATAHYFDAAITHGSITAPIQAGHFSNIGISTTPALPDVGSGNNGGYFIDPLFTASGGTSTVTSDLDLRWAVRSGVTSDLDLRWDILSLTTVTSDLDLRWNVQAGTSVRQPGGGWWALDDIFAQNDAYRRADRDAPPLACPFDGEPLRPGPHGGLYCPWGNYRWRC